MAKLKKACFIGNSYTASNNLPQLVSDLATADGNTFIPDGLTAEETSYLQNAATHVFTDVDSITVDYTTPIASFSVSFDGPIATYTNTSAHGFEYFWEFGDGETSTDEHPVHEYPDESEYIATLTLTNCGQEDLSVGGIDDTGINDYHQSNLNVFPNPSKGTVTMRFDGTSALEIFTLDGQLYFNEIVNEQKILALPSGVYLVRVNNDMRKLIVL